MDAAVWSPTKYVDRGGRLRAGTTGPASGLMAEIVAEWYDGALARHARGDLLDLGCGQAPLYAGYRTRATSVTTSDWKPAPVVDVVADLTAVPLPFGDAAFDTVVLSDVLEHIPTPGALLADVARVLRPGGTLLLNVPFLYGVHEAPYDFHRYTEFALRRMAQEAGLEVVELSPLGGLLEVLGDFVGKALTVVPVLGPRLATGLQRLVWAVHASPAGRAAGRRTGPLTPSGYAMAVRRPA